MINDFKTQRIFYLFFIIYLSFSSSLWAQTGPEICDNGIDDDGDGLIDCYDPDCCGDQACANTFYDPCDIAATCLNPIPTGAFSIQRSRTSSNSANLIYDATIPVVGDIDNDGITEYVAANTNGPVHIFKDGATSLTHSATLNGSGTIINGTKLGTLGTTNITDPYPTIGDLDPGQNNGAEIIIRQSFGGEFHLCVYSATGTLLAFYNLEGTGTAFQFQQNTSGGTNRTGTSGVYDFDGDGTPEISHGLGIFRYNPSATIGTRLELLAYPTTVVGTGLNNNYFGEQVVAVDIDDPNLPGYLYGLELIAGNTVYNVNPTTSTPPNGTILGTPWSITTKAIANTTTPVNTMHPDGYTSTVDWDGDNLLDVVVSSNRNNSAFLYVWNPRTEVIIAQSNAIGGNGNMSRASVTDFDNDGALEIVVTTPNNFRIFEETAITSGVNTLTEAASITTTDISGNTTCTAFDFNYDGTKEIVYRDEDDLRIFRYTPASPGVLAALTEVANTPCVSGTVVEYPIIADVDNDGQAEIVCACRGTGTTVNSAVVTVFESNSFPWADTRSLWNQHAYFYANVDDDLSIPKNQQNHALPDNGAAFTYPGQINSFLHQYADTVFRLPNAVLKHPIWDCETNTITVEVCNNGDNTLPAGMPITIYSGDPTNSNPTIIGSATLGINILPNAPCQNVTIPLTTTYGLATTVFVMLNADGTTTTAFDPANYTPPISTILECDYTDNIGNVIVHPTPTIGINASLPNPVCQNDVLTLTATSSNNSIDAVAWTPTTLGTNNPVTVPTSLSGSHTYTVTVTDNNGCSGTASIDVEVEECCPIKKDSSYFHLTANTDPALLAQYNIIPVPMHLSVQGKTRYMLIGSNGHHSLPNRLYIDDGIILEVRGAGAVLDLVNSDVVFGECARLEILNGGELRAYNTVFRPCDEAASWGGIIFTNTAVSVTELPTGNIRECTFINADVGLYLGHFAEGGYSRVFQNQSISEITIQDNLFSNCRKGIRVYNLAPNQAISGNDFQIDNVDNITFHGHDKDCTPILNNNNYIGIELLSAVNQQNLRPDYALNIHQNTFIDATSIASSQSEYTGVQSLVGIAQLEISANDFTNMFQSIRIGLNTNNRPITIENNEINVTRRAVLNNTGSSQIVLSNGTDIEIFNNKLSCSAEAPALTVLANQNAAFMQSAINIDNSSRTILRDNTIEGFEVGIYVHQAGNSGQRRIKVVDNEIKSNYYGIFLDSELNTTVNNSLNAFIQCNEIEMDLENNTTSVGIAAHFNGVISPSTNHYISGNCVKHTHRAIEIVNNTTTPARMPTVLNNYLYNYLEAGISIDGEFNRHGGGTPTIGQFNHSLTNPADPVGGHNTFISNNENNAFDIFATATSTAIEAINNDYGTIGTAIIDNNLNNVEITQGTNLQYPSFAKCANQDASLTQDEMNTLASYRHYYWCGEDELFRAGGLLFKTTTSGTTVLQGNYAQVVQDLAKDNDGNSLYGLAIEALNNLSNQVDRNTLYTTVTNTGLLTTNQTAWLSYQYERNQGNYAAAKQIVQNIQGETEDEEALKAIQIINMDLSISSRGIQEMTNDEIQTLKTIDDRRGIYAVDARTMVDAAIGGHDYIFAPYPLSKPFASKNISRLDLKLPNLTIYPNPTNNAINIDFVVTAGSDQILNIYNATGKLVKSVSAKAMVGKLTVDVTDLTQGMYIATLKSEDGSIQSGKFVKQ